MIRALFDTNIIIDALKGWSPALDEIQGIQEPLISRISWIEILVGARSEEQHIHFEGFLQGFGVLELTEHVARETIEVRKEFKLKLPDAMIYATARIEEALLVTRNIKDFPRRADIRFPYKI